MLGRRRAHSLKGVHLMLLTATRVSCHPCKKYHSSPLKAKDPEQVTQNFLEYNLSCQTTTCKFSTSAPPPPPPPPPHDKPIALHLIQPTTENWIIMGNFNSHSPSWGYDKLDSKGEEVECWATNQQLILINEPQDPPTFYSRSWRTTSTPDLAFATDNIHKLCHREVCSQLGPGGSDHRHVTILVDQKTPVSTFKRPPSWNYKKADWDSFKQFAEEKCMGLQLSEENVNYNAVHFNNAVPKQRKSPFPWDEEGTTAPSGPHS